MKPREPIYLDYNATTPADPRVVEFMLPYFSEKFGNPASKTHAFGWAAEEAVELARERIAKLIGGESSEIVFTSGATEAVNLAIKGVFEKYASKGNHIITCVTEHKAVLDTCRHLEQRGAEISYLPVSGDGLINPEHLENEITEKTILISVMYAHNETGVIQPIREISEIARRHQVLFFTDATQAVGKTPVDVQAEGIDLMAFSAHKMYGPKGTGALYVRRKNPRVSLTAQIDGGGHERGRRSGTLNVPAIAGFGKACEIALQEMHEDIARLGRLREKLENAFLEEKAVSLNGSKNHRLRHVSNLSFEGVDRNGFMMEFNKKIAVSSGSACTSALMQPSYVLKAMGKSDELAYGSLRFSLGKLTTEKEIDEAIFIIKNALKNQRRQNPQWQMKLAGMDLKN